MTTRKIWAAQPPQEMNLWPERKLAAILGTTVHIRVKSMMESWLRKKYIGVCRRLSAWMSRRKRMLPARVATEARRTRENRNKSDGE
jgi:hypothetical protein